MSAINPKWHKILIIIGLTGSKGSEMSDKPRPSHKASASKLDVTVFISLEY